MKAQSGDRIRIKTSDSEYEGMLMPRPDILEKGVVVLKLDSGYNIGIDENTVEKIDVLLKFEPKKIERREQSHKAGLPLVSILSFGGTISSKVDYRTGGTYADYTAEDFVQMMPELEGFANLRAKKVMGIMSEDMVPDDWMLIARAVLHEVNDKEVSGVVVTQGTDTMHFSSAALSFLLRNLTKPVIFTAAQRSIDRGSSDAFMNLLCSVHAAKSEIAEVMVCMHGSLDDTYCLLIRGTKVRKMHTSRRDAFRPINELPLAKVFVDGNIEVVNSHFKKRSPGMVSLSHEVEKKVGLIYVHPGIDGEIFDFFTEKKYRGLVVAGTGLGHVPTYNPKHSVISNLKKLADSGCVIVIAPQTINGRLHGKVYSAARELSVKIGCVHLEDTHPETAYAKLCWALGQEKDPQKIKEMMVANIAGEITQRSDARAFEY